MTATAGGRGEVRHVDLDLTEAGARALLADIRTAISTAQELLRLAWHQRIWVALDYPSWDAFVAAELGDLRLRLPVEERRAEVGVWRAEGASVRAIASALGVSAGTVSGDLAQVLDENMSKGVGTADTPAVVISLDGRRRAARRSTPSQGADVPRSVSLRVLDALAAAGADGLTLVEVSRRLKIRDGSSSGALSRLEAQGHCARTGERRDGRSVYVLAGTEMSPDEQSVGSVGAACLGRSNSVGDADVRASASHTRGDPVRLAPG